MMQKLQELPISLRILAYAAAVATVLVLAAAVGVMAALALSSDRGLPEVTKPETSGAVNPGMGGKLEEGAEGGDAYANSIAVIQKESVQASIESNDKLLNYDGLTGDDVEEMKSNYVALESYVRRAKDLAPPAEYEDQHEVFVVAIGELRDADELAYRLAADPFSATQADFEAYDRYVARATAHLRTSNELLGKDYKTTEAAGMTSFG